MHSQRLRQQKLKQQQARRETRAAGSPAAAAAAPASPTPSSPTTRSPQPSPSPASGPSSAVAGGRQHSLTAPVLISSPLAPPSPRRATAHPLLRATSAQQLPPQTTVPTILSPHSSDPTQRHSLSLPSLVLPTSSLSSSAPPSPLTSGRRDLNHELLQLLSQDEGRVMLALLSSYKFMDMDSITQAAVDYFFAAERDPNHPLLVHLISTVLREEILSHAEDESTLFRSKTNGSKMLSLCLRICCMNYLKDAIGPVIARVCAEAPAVEIDPSRTSSPEIAQENVANLTGLCEDFLAAIFSTVDLCPVFIRDLFARMQSCMATRFPENKQITINYSTVGGFIFLRFFCSAIFTPIGFGLVGEQPKADSTRALALASKVLQMLANGLTFGSKANELYMQNMNPFLEKHKTNIIDFFRAIATVPEDHDLATASEEEETYRGPPGRSLPGAEVLLGSLHKYAADLASALRDRDPSGASTKALAVFLVTFPAPTTTRKS